MLMSHDAISSGVATRPRFWLSADAVLDTTAITEAAARSLLCVNMLHLTILGNTPTRDPIEVVERFGAAIGNEFGARGLDEPCLIRGATLQDGGSAVPAPRHAEPSERHRQDRLLQRRWCPGFAGVGRNLDLGDLPVARPSEARNLVKGWPFHRQARRRLRDHRLGLHWKDELERFPFGQQHRVFRSLVLRHSGTFGHLDAPKPLNLHVAFVARQQKPHRIAIGRAYTLTVLVERDQCGLTKNATFVAVGTSSCSSSNCFGASVLVRMATPVTLPSGRLRLVMRPNCTGSAPVRKMTGIFVVAALAASPAAMPPGAAMTATWRATRSAASAGRRSYRPSAQRNSILTLRLST